MDQGEFVVAMHLITMKVRQPVCISEPQRNAPSLNMYSSSISFSFVRQLKGTPLPDALPSHLNPKPSELPNITESVRPSVRFCSPAQASLSLLC
jgi:hypothetical protein